jgi:hypothetical protein
MKPIIWHPGDPTGPDLLGTVVAHNVRTVDGKKFLLKKGAVLDPERLERLAHAASEVHLLRPEPGELHEDLAGLRLARAVCGPGVRIKGLIGAQYQLVAERRGLLRVDPCLVRAINAIEGLTLFTTFDHQPVEAGELVAAAKCTPFLIAEEKVAQAEQIAQQSPALRVEPYQPMRVGVLLLERVSPEARERFEDVLRLKLGYFGAQLGALVEARQSEAEIVPALRRLLDDGHDVVMLAGASSLDPLEPLFPALGAVGAKIIKHGAPAHPGSLFWIAYAGRVPLFGLSSCEMFSHKTVLDLILPRVFAGEPVQREQIVELGYGGLLEAGMDWRFPNYGRDAAPGAD